MIQSPIFFAGAPTRLLKGDSQEVQMAAAQPEGKTLPFCCPSRLTFDSQSTTLSRSFRLVLLLWLQRNGGKKRTRPFWFDNRLMSLVFPVWPLWLDWQLEDNNPRITSSIDVLTTRRTRVKVCHQPITDRNTGENQDTSRTKLLFSGCKLQPETGQLSFFGWKVGSATTREQMLQPSRPAGTFKLSLPTPLSLNRPSPSRSLLFPTSPSSTTSS